MNNWFPTPVEVRTMLEICKWTMWGPSLVRLIETYVHIINNSQALCADVQPPHWLELVAREVQHANHQTVKSLSCSHMNYAANKLQFSHLQWQHFVRSYQLSFQLQRCILISHVLPSRNIVMNTELCVYLVNCWMQTWQCVDSVVVLNI